MRLTSCKRNRRSGFSAIRPRRKKYSADWCGLILSVVVRASDCFAAKAAPTLCHALRSANVEFLGAPCPAWSKSVD